MNAGRLGLSAVVAGLVGSCAAAPPITEPDLGTGVPAAWAALDGAGAPGEPDPVWWQDFGDPLLDEIVLEALAENRDLRSAAARVARAAAQARIAGADTLPQLGLELDAARSRQNFVGLPIPGGPDVLTNLFTNYGVSLALSWELDIWGRLRKGASAAIADRQSADADYHAATLSLVGQTAKAWFAATEASRQVALAARVVESYRRTAEQVRERYERGLRPSLDVRLALSDLASTEADLQERLAARDRIVRQLEILLGRYPAAALETAGELPPVPPPVPAGLPADLVSRRPDLAALERRLAAAGARVGAARAALYPRISLSASGGRSSSELGDLLDGNFSVWTLAANFFQPVFQGGRLLAGLDLARAEARESLADYLGGALRAYAEVETSLALEAYLAEREGALRTAVEQALAALDLARDRYTRGLDDIITLLSAQQQAYRAESRLLSVRRLALEARIDLHLALGGGFRRTPRADETPRPVEFSARG